MAGLSCWAAKEQREPGVEFSRALHWEELGRFRYGRIMVRYVVGQLAVEKVCAAPMELRWKWPAGEGHDVRSNKNPQLGLGVLIATRQVLLD